MVHRNLPILLAVGGSIIVHSLFFATAPEYHVSPLVLTTQSARTAARHESRLTLVLVDPKDAPPDEPVPDKGKPPEKSAKEDASASEVAAPKRPEKPKPLPPKPPDVDLFPDRMGELTGKGIGANAAEGLEPLKAREGDQDQGFLSRDPRGRGMVGDPPSPTTLAPGDGGTGGIPGRPGMALQVPTAAVQTQDRSPRLPEQIQPTAPRIEPMPDRVALPGPKSLPLPAPEHPPEIVALLPRPAPPAQAPVKGEPEASRPVRMEKAEPARQESDSKTPSDRTSPARPIQVAMVMPPVAPKDQGAVGIAHPAMPLPPPAPPHVDLPPEIPPAPAPVSPVALVVVTQPPAAPPAAPPPAAPSPPAPAAPAAQALPGAAATGDGHAPGPRHPSADPAQQSESESDPFSKIGSYNLRDGKLDPQFGRKVKTTRPKIPIVGQVDAFAMVGTAVTLKVSIDATGKVTEVAIAKSSGSNEIDQPCLIAMYDWWFEPLKDKKGNPLPDTLLFTIGFR